MPDSRPTIAKYSRWGGWTLMAASVAGGVAVVVGAGVLVRSRDEIKDLPSYSNDAFRAGGFWLFLCSGFLMCTFVYGYALLRVGRTLARRVTTIAFASAALLWFGPLGWGLLSLTHLRHYSRGYALEPVTISRLISFGAVTAGAVGLWLTARAWRAATRPAVRRAAFR